jgi:hypothetical protein
MQIIGGEDGRNEERVYIAATLDPLTSHELCLQEQQAK